MNVYEKDLISALQKKTLSIVSMQRQIDAQADMIDELRRKLAEAESENVRLRAMLLAEEMVEL